MTRLAVLLLMLLGLGPAGALAEVRVEGLVERPGRYPLAEGGRLLDAIGPAQVRAEAYLLGAAWLNRAAVTEQRELKIGLIFDLAVLERRARLEGRPDLATLARRLAEQVRNLPVSGRRPNTLDPLRLETEPASNRLLDDGDRLLFPPRPWQIRITGAVRIDCHLPFSGLQPAVDYLRDCPRHPAADPDWLYLIQPDGQISRLGIGAWNRDPDQVLAPGAVLYVPLDESALMELAEDLNREMARFIATQPLPLDGVTEDYDETSGPRDDCPFFRTATGNQRCPG